MTPTNIVQIKKSVFLMHSVDLGVIFKRDTISSDTKRENHEFNKN
jgi:hypothetical protein